MKPWLGVLSVVFLSGGPAVAQSTPDNDINRVESRIDRRFDRERSSARGVVEDVRPWTFTVSSPFRFSSNVAGVDTGAQSGFYVDPTIDLAGEWDLGGVILSTDTSADSQTFLSHGENDNSTLLWNGRLTVTAGSLSPYFDYTGLALFDGQFEDHSVTVHQFTAGAVVSHQLDVGNSLTFDVSVSRRESSLAEIELQRATVAAKLKHSFDEDTSLTLLARGRYADFSGGANSGRVDKNVLASLAISRRLSKTLAADFGVSLERNWSNTEAKSYTVWEAGPSLAFSTSF